MEPIISQKPKTILLGMSFFGDPFDTHRGWEEENEIGCLWQRLMRFMEDNSDKMPPLANPNAAFEVHVYHPETTTKGMFEVFVGLEIIEVGNIPVELVLKVLPPSKFVVFTFRGEEIASDWHMRIHQWISNAGFKQAYPFSYQYLDQRFKGVDNLAESELDVYMPIQSKSNRK